MRTLPLTGADVHVAGGDVEAVDRLIDIVIAAGDPRAGDG
jgi:hypothetical protein